MSDMAVDYEDPKTRRVISQKFVDIGGDMHTKAIDPSVISKLDEISTKLDAANALLASIDSKLDGPLGVTIVT